MSEIEQTGVRVVGKVVAFRREAVAMSDSELSTGKKSSAVTRPPVAVLKAIAKSLDSHALPRRKREIIDRSHLPPKDRTSEAIAASFNPARIMNSESFMEGCVRSEHMLVNGDCAQPILGPQGASVHNLHMARGSAKVKTKIKEKPESVWTRTFLMEYRKQRGMTQGEAAKAMGFKRHSDLSKIENGKQQYTQRVLEHAAKLYKTSIWHLLYCPPNTPLSDLLKIWQESVKVPD